MKTDQDKQAQSTIRIGHFDFLNGYPLYYGLEKGEGWGCFELVRGVPTELNRLLLDGELDISPISSIEYAANPDELLLFPLLTISSDGAVDSIRLISNLPIDQVGSVALTAQSATSVALLKILLGQRYGLDPDYSILESDVESALDDRDAVLLIGDQALSAFYQEPAREGRLSYDLGAEWKQFTGLPMVFALWAVRRDFFRERPDETYEVQDRLIYSVEYSHGHWDELVEVAAGHYSFGREALKAYFNRLRYDFTDDYRKGLLEFYRRSAEAGISPGVPELNFI